MENKNGSVHISLDVARIMYNSDNEVMKDIALEAYDEDELIGNFSKILSFDDACAALDIHYGNALNMLEEMEIASVASVAMFKLNIIRKALNMKYELSLTKKPYTNDDKMTRIYYPYVAIVPKKCEGYDKEYNVEVIGNINSDGKVFSVLGGYSSVSPYNNLCHFDTVRKLGYTDANVGFLGCASEEIASYFGRRFGMLIVQAQYADMVKDFEILESKYNIN